MADTKISALPSGAPAQAADETVIARGGANYKLTVANIVGYLGSPITVANGGTGASTLTGVVKGNGAGAFTAGTVNLTSEITGTLPIANGGTGVTTLTANNVLLGNGTSAVQFVAPGTTGNVLTSNGTTWTSAAPSGLPELQVVSATTQAAVKGKHYVLTNASLTTVTLPATPASGDTVWVTVANGRVDNVVARNGSNIISLASDLVLNATYAAVQLRYADATRGWILI